MTTRQANVPFRSLALTEEKAEEQHQKGLYTIQQGVWIPIPVDNIKRPQVFLNKELWRQDEQGRVFRPGVKFEAPNFAFQGKALAWLRDHVNENIPHLYYMATLGHDLHVSTYADLFAKHFHAGWANPFNPDKIDSPLDPNYTHDCDKPNCPLKNAKPGQVFGFIESLGWLSGGKVTTAFVAKECDELEGTGGGEYADFDFHEVGTDATAEANSQTALIATSGIARATGTPSSTATTYVSVGTVTADATETWEEHGLFCNTTGATLMDRSLTGGQSVNNLDQVQYTYTLTKNPEA